MLKENKVELKDEDLKKVSGGTHYTSTHWFSEITKIVQTQDIVFIENELNKMKSNIIKDTSIDEEARKGLLDYINGLTGGGH